MPGIGFSPDRTKFYYAESRDGVCVYDFAADRTIANRRVLAELPLPIGGLMSDRPAHVTAAGITSVTESARRHLGVTATAPFMQLSFLGLSVIPQLRITDKGLVDVEAFELTGLTVPV